jgi:hypothetical protein
MGTTQRSFSTEKRSLLQSGDMENGAGSPGTDTSNFSGKGSSPVTGIIQKIQSPSWVSPSVIIIVLSGDQNWL